MIVALCVTAIVVIALLSDISWPYIERRLERRRANREARRHGVTAPYDPGRERRAEQRARELLKSCVNDEEWGMYADLGFIRVWGGQSGLPADAARDLRGVPYAYLVYPHKPIVAYLPQTGQLLNEYCVEFPDETRPYGSRAAAGLRRRAGEVDGAEGRRAAPDRRGQPAPAGPSDRPQAGPARHLAPRALGARAARAPRGERPRGAVPASGAARQPISSGLSMAGLDPRHNSRALVDGPSRAGARAQLKGIGFDDEALSKPIIGVATTWTETMPCNFNHRALAAKVKEGVRAAGGTPMEFNTIAISDGITMGSSRHAGVADQPRGDRRLDRARLPRPPVRRGDRDLGLRQDHPRHGHGAGPAERAVA